jgi:hypothetical protein
MDSQPSPIPIPAAMREWSAGARNSRLTRKNSILETPSRTQNAFKEKKAKVVQQGRPNVSEVKFPGFENSFAHGAPAHSPTRTRNGGQTNDFVAPRLTQRGKSKDKAQNQVIPNLFSPSKGPPKVFNFDDLSAADETIQDFDGDVVIGDGSPHRHKPPENFDGVQTTPSISGCDIFIEPEEEQVLSEVPFVGIDWREEVKILVDI